MSTVDGSSMSGIFEDGDFRSMRLEKWTIRTRTSSISNANDIDELQKCVGFPLPEMTFGNNYLEMTYVPSGWSYRFDAREALKYVKNGELVEGDGGVKVRYAKAWLKSRTEPNTSLPLPKTAPTKPYDWTYTSVYPGHISSSEPGSVFTRRDDEQYMIPTAELRRPDPILFYAQIPLYEDELHDNGSSILVVRIRVMPNCIFILSRFVLRVDNVLFRAYDTRIYHSFTQSPPVVIRETSGWEVSYERIKKYLPDKHDLSPLADPNFILQTITGLPKAISQKEGASTGWRELGTKVEVVNL